MHAFADISRSCYNFSLSVTELLTLYLSCTEPLFYKRASSSSVLSEGYSVDLSETSSGSLEYWRERAMEAESKLATSESQVLTLINASKESAMANSEQVDELITELNEARSALEESQKVGQEMREKELMYQQQLASLKEALRELGTEREAAFVALGEYKEQGMDQAEELMYQQQESDDEDDDDILITICISSTPAVNLGSISVGQISQDKVDFPPHVSLCGCRSFPPQDPVLSSERLIKNFAALPAQDEGEDLRVAEKALAKKREEQEAMREPAQDVAVDAIDGYACRRECEVRELKRQFGKLVSCSWYLRKDLYHQAKKVSLTRRQSMQYRVEMRDTFLT